MTLHRRDALKGITLGAGSVLLAPVLARLEAQTAGEAVAAKRLAVPPGDYKVAFLVLEQEIGRAHV